MQVYYKSLRDQIDKDQLDAILSRLHPDKCAAILRKTREENRYQSLMGLHLLEKGVTELGLSPVYLNQIVDRDRQKPHWPNQNLDFNISHSAEHVVCVISQTHQVGVDIEVYREIESEKFTRYFDQREMEYIEDAPEFRLKHFFKIWTAKEAVTKAVGTGISGISEVSIDPNNQTAKYLDKIWAIQWEDKTQAMMAIASSKFS